MREGDPIAPRPELERLHRTLRREAMTAVRKYYAVSGARMTGKTTLVWELRRRLAQDGITLLYVDLGTQRGVDLDGFYRFLCREMVEQWPFPVHPSIRELIDGPGRFDQNRFMDYLRRLSDTTGDKRRVALALDSVGAADRAEVAAPFYSTFRGLLNDHAGRYWRYLFLFIGSLDLYELPNGALSPLLNVCEDIRVANLSAEAVAALAAGLADGNPDLPRRIHQATDGHPYLTQRLCQICQGQVDLGREIDLDRAVEEMLGREEGSRADPYIGEILRHLERNEALRKWVDKLLDASEPIPFSGPHDPSMYRPSLLGIARRGADGDCAFANQIVERAVRGYFDSSGSHSIGRFALKGRIYSGPRAVVHKAWHPELDIPLAIKVLPSEWFESEEDIARFQAEARTMMEFRHPHICPVYDFGRHGREYYIVMKFVQGGSLQALLSGEATEVGEGSTRERRLRPLLMLLPIADAIHYAHGKGVVHRDLKPSNVVIDLTTEGHVPLVIDFGLARNIRHPLVGRTESRETLLGTPAYLSPELAEGDQSKVGIPSDVYQLGGMLYQILSGNPPHSGSSLESIIVKALRSEPVPPSRIDPTVPEVLETICLRTLRRDPEERYPSAAAFRDDLARAIGELQGGELVG